MIGWLYEQERIQLVMPIEFIIKNKRLGIKWNERFKCNIKTAWLDGYISRPGFDW